MPDYFRTALATTAPHGDVARFARRWAAEAFGAHAASIESESGIWRSGDQQIEIWSGDHDGESAFELRWTLPSEHPGDRWLIEIAAASDGRSGPDGALTTIEAAVRLDAADPRSARAAGFRRLSFVRRLIDQFACRRDGILLSSQAVTVGPDDAADFVGQVLTRANRTLPVIAVSRDDADQTAIDPQALQRDLAGVAVVAEWKSATSRRIASLLGNHNACYGGAVRVYRPGLTRSDSPARHRYVLRSRALQEQFGHEIREFAARVNRELPPEVRCDEIADRIRLGERARLAAQVEELSQALQLRSGVAAERSDSLHETIQALQWQQRQLEQERDRWRDQAQRLDRALEMVAARQASGEAASPPDDPESVADAVQLAEAYCAQLILFANAHESAAESRYQPAGAVWEHLQRLNDLGQALADGMGEAQMVGWLRTRNVDVSSESSDTMRRYGDERRFRNADGDLVEMESHIKLGGGSGADAWCRIHFCWNPVIAKIEVGHVGRHLQTGRS